MNTRDRMEALTLGVASIWADQILGFIVRAWQICRHTGRRLCRIRRRPSGSAALVLWHTTPEPSTGSIIFIVFVFVVLLWLLVLIALAREDDQ